MESVTINADEVGAFSTGHEQLNFLEAINFAIPEIDKLRANLTTKRDQLNSELSQHEDYAMADAAAKDAAKLKREAKMRAMKHPICSEIADDISSLQSDLTMQKSVLSDVAVKYAETTGKTEFHAPDGTTFKIIKVAKLVKEKAFRRKR